MIEPMWAWGALGLILLAIEMTTATFYAMWFGIAAFCVAITMWIWPNTAVGVQFALFAITSLSALAIWRFNYEKTETHSRVGQAQGEEIGRTGIVIEATSPAQNGVIHFTQGLMGSREWAAVSNETIEAGSQATVIAVEGNALRISKSS